MERHQNEERKLDYYKRSYYDSVTGLPGMSFFFELAEEGRRDLLSKGEEVAFLFVDMSGLKDFNEKYGFAEGDKLIRSFSKVLVKYFGNENCSHFFGDHFAVYTTSNGLESKLDSLFDECKLINNGRNLPVRAGIYIDKFGSIEISTACDRAKTACDAGKEVHSSQAYFFDFAMVEQLEKRQYVVDHLDKAIEEGWIEVHYQPIVRAANGRVCEEECLSRWNDPENGFMTPADFIPILEESNTIYKLDLCVIDQVLNKLKSQASKGLFMVPQTVNLSKEDFYACDMVEEIKKRVDDAGIGREYLTIEIAESAVANDIEFMKKQVERFQKMGFSVWMDDYGSGYASPIILQKIHFNLIKFDNQFVEQIGEKEDSGARIVFTELVKTVMALNMDTVAEGVETGEQADFLKEIGCTKLQGTYYLCPVTQEEIYERNRKGIQIGFENPAEVEYYEALGRVNLYDLSISKNDDALKKYFDTMPMVIFEVGEEHFDVVRANQSYREFVGRALSKVEGIKVFEYKDYGDGAWGDAIKALRQCAKDGKRVILEKRLPDGDVAQLFFRRIATNPVNGVSAVAAVVLSFVDKNTAASGLTYTHVARALSEDYIYLYYVDMDTDKFIEYGGDYRFDDLPIERHGDDFFNLSKEQARDKLYIKDQEHFLEVFTKENIQKSIDENGSFNFTYRLLIDDTPTYVSMKALPIKTTGNHIIIGVNNVDVQMKQREAFERIKEEQITFARMSALSGDYICIYVVDPQTESFTEFSSTDEFAKLGISKKGDGFFASSIRNAGNTIYAEDLDMFVEFFNKDNILKHIKDEGLFSVNYRLMLNGHPTYVNLRAAMVEESDGPQLIVGISNIDAQVKRDQEYAINLTAARDKANVDELTGVKNKHAYVDVELRLNDMIEEDAAPQFAIVVFDLNGLKAINDTYGHQAGDKFIKDGCSIICDIFKHSPVFRVGGDEFVVVVQGLDYENIEELMQTVSKINKENNESNKVVIAAGMARYRGDKRVSAVFERADARMYENKKLLKGIKD